MFRYSRPHLHGALSEHHQLSVWVTSTLGISKLAAQFYFYNFEIVLNVWVLGHVKTCL